MASTPPAGIAVTVGGTRHEFPADRRVKIGRDPDNDIVVDNPHVSRQHALLSRQAETWVLESVKPSGLHHQGSAVTRVPVTGATEVWLAAPPDGERVELVVSAGDTTVTPGAAAAPVTAPTVAAGGGAPVNPPGGPLQRSGGGIRVRLNGREQAFPGDRTITIGRLPGSDVQAQSEFVSREHATLRSDRGTWIFESRGQHGTFLEGAPVSTLTLAGPTTLRLGDAQQGDVLELLPEGPSAATQTPPAAARTPGAAVPGGALAADRVTGNTSMVRRLTASNRRTVVFAGVVAVLALVLGGVAVFAAVRGGSDDITGVVEEATPKTAFIKYADQRRWNGTGAIMDAERGFVVTNAHVVEDPGALQAGVVGEVRSASLNGIAPCDDLAVMQVADATGLQEFTLGSQDELRSGQRVISLGYPTTFSEQPRLITGEGVVANPRTDYAAAGYINLVQNTAQINPGNSGGPLIDLDGQLVGINSLYKFTEIDGVRDSRPIQNQYYAIASDRVAELFPILQSGVSLGDDGIGPRNLVVIEPTPAPRVPDSLVLVAGIRDGSPASDQIFAPFARGGWVYVAAILRIDGTPIGSAGDYCNAIRDMRESQDSAKYSVGVFRLREVGGDLVIQRMRNRTRPAVSIDF